MKQNLRISEILSRADLQKINRERLPRTILVKRNLLTALILPKRWLILHKQMVSCLPKHG